MHAQNVLQRYWIDRADIRLNLDIAEVIKGAFLDREGDDEALDRGIVFAGRRDNLHVGIAVSQVETPDQVAVGLDAVGVVDVGGLQKAQEIGGGGLDHLLEAIIRIGVIADEDDGSDAGLFAFPDFKDEVDAIVRPLDDFRHHLNVEAAIAVIDLDDARDVGLHHRLRQCAARFRLDFLLKLLVLELVVALERDAVDDRGFNDGDNQAAAGLRNADVLKQARAV